MPENADTIVLRHDPERRAASALRLVHRADRNSAQSQNAVQMQHTEGILHTRELRRKGVRGVTVDVPEFCPNHCTCRCTEIIHEGSARWQCPDCGIIF